MTADAMETRLLLITLSPSSWAQRWCCLSLALIEASCNRMQPHLPCPWPRAGPVEGIPVLLTNHGTLIGPEATKLQARSRGASKFGAFSADEYFWR